MSLNPEELEKHCQEILNDRRIKNRIVVLCEGIIRDIEGIKSPQAYRNIERLPDANFYKRCVPRSWKGKLTPHFLNCGSRNDVINTYFQLLKLHNSSASYLNKNKLFALIDLDLQLQKIDNYHLSDTEQIFFNIYKNTQVIPQQVNKHSIWITGLIHKEAYFITPDVQETLDNSKLNPQFNNIKVLLRDVYLKICDEITKDIDLKDNFDRVINRINFCQNLDCCHVDKLKKTWQKEFSKSSNQERIRELVFVLLTIRKAKEYWHQIKPNSDWQQSNKSETLFREQLSLEIASHYSKQDWNNPNNHLAYFFKTLYQFA